LSVVVKDVAFPDTLSVWVWKVSEQGKNTENVKKEE
jgi:hypothetical protein